MDSLGEIVQNESQLVVNKSEIKKLWRFSLVAK